MTHPFLQVSPFDSDFGALIGRDPRTIREGEWRDHMPTVAVGMKAIRAKCLDCAHNAAEVRKCVHVDCPLWPLRMGSYPKGLRSLRKNGDDGADFVGAEDRGAGSC